MSLLGWRGEERKGKLLMLLLCCEGEVKPGRRMVRTDTSCIHSGVIFFIVTEDNYPHERQVEQADLSSDVEVRLSNLKAFQRCLFDQGGEIFPFEYK